MLIYISLYSSDYIFISNKLESLPFRFIDIISPTFRPIIGPTRF
nr:MAG TPA: hypothetical protein [Caudoviricetes sp.]